MDMNVMLSPKGRSGPVAFRNAALILIGINVILSLLPLVSLTVAMLGSLVGLVLIYPWIVIWVRRLHDAGKSGWMILLVILLYLIVAGAASWVVSAQFGGPQPDYAASAGDFSAMMAMITENMRATLIPNLICSTIISLIFVFGANAILKSDPGPNAYGPPPAQ